MKEEYLFTAYEVINAIKEIASEKESQKDLEVGLKKPRGLYQSRLVLCFQRFSV